MAETGSQAASCLRWQRRQRTLSYFGLKSGHVH
jgi:hypothetical protein